MTQQQDTSTVPPDFQIGFGSEIEEGGTWSTDVSLVFLVLVCAVVAYVIQARKRKAKKR